MTDSHPPVEYDRCFTCKAKPGDVGASVLIYSRDDVMVEAWHSADCPDDLQRQREIEEGAKRYEAEQARAEALFPEAYSRLRSAHEALPEERRSDPFVAALVDLVSLKAEREAERGGFVILPEWADILDRHFPESR